MIININDSDYELSASLRVAYMVQGQHNHKPYSDVFAGISDMVLEDQIGILYAAFKVANPDVLMTRDAFLNYYLDHYNLKTMMDQVKDVIAGIMGVDPEELNASTAKVSAEEVSGN